MASVLMDIQNLEKTYRLNGGFLRNRPRIVYAVTGIQLQIYRGETLGLVGESGCGKSTLARLLMRLERPDAGGAYFHGRNIFDLKADDLKKYRRSVQMIFQDPYSSLNPRKTAMSIIREPLDIHGPGGRRKNRETVAILMKKVGLSDEQAGRYPHEFSGGQRQRIGIARALALQPELVIADEPVSALDASIQAQILNLLQNLKKDFSLTYLFISHDLNVVRHVSDRIAVMYMGRIVELAEKNDLYQSPVHPYTRMLLSAMPVCDPLQKKQNRIPQGEAGNPGSQGCAFKNRCAYKIAVCEEIQPMLKSIQENKWCACHRAGDFQP